MSQCIRGCIRRRKHLAELCLGEERCKGCEPRRANHGLLCEPCHRRLKLMFTQATIAEDWLTGNLPEGMKAAATKQDYEQRHATTDPASPLSLAIMDARDLMRDRLTAYVDDLCEVNSLTGPSKHTVQTDSQFLLAWLDQIESLEWISDWFEEFAETLSDAHSLAPWRPEVHRLHGIPCPECHVTNLVIFGGESDVTCMECRAMFDHRRFGIWERVIESEREVSA